MVSMYLINRGDLQPKNNLHDDDLGIYINDSGRFPL